MTVMPERTLTISVTDLPWFKTAMARILELHQPTDEEAEFWWDMPGHHERFPECAAERQCEGHTVTVQVCQECGYEHDGDMAMFRAWPCPTYLAMTAAFTEPEGGGHA